MKLIEKIVKTVARKRVKSLAAKKKNILNQDFEVEVSVDLDVFGPVARLQWPVTNEQQSIRPETLEMSPVSQRKIRVETKTIQKVEVYPGNLSGEDDRKYRRLDGKSAFWEKLV